MHYFLSVHAAIDIPSTLSEGVNVLVKQLDHFSVLGLQAPFLGTELEERLALCTRKGGIVDLRPSVYSHSSYDPAECCETSSCPGP